MFKTTLVLEDQSRQQMIKMWKWCAVMVKDRQLSVRMIAEEMGLNKNAVHRILTEHLHMRKICAKLMPKKLCGGNSEPVGNLSGFAGKTQN